MKRTWGAKVRAATGGFLAMMALLALIGVALAVPAPAGAVTMADYTNFPLFMGQTVPPNILFIVDLGNENLPAAYSGPSHQYPISHKAGTQTATGKIASNVTLSDFKLVSVSSAAAKLITCADGTETCNTSLVTSSRTTPSDLFDSTKTYFGIFDPLRCYVQGGSGTPFTHGSVKVAVADACGTAHWDGNFLNWLGMRKKDVAYQVLVGGSSKPAQSNTDGTADKLEGENTTGENGTTQTCGNPVDSKTCWRYVKFVPPDILTGRAPSTVTPFTMADEAAATVRTNKASDSSAQTGGRFFGLGEGKIYINTDNNDDFFDASSASAQFQLGVDLNTEPDVPSGTGSASDSCTGTPFAGHRVCYKRDRSLGIFQKLRLENMHIGVMFADAAGGKAGRMQFNFDDNFNAASITAIRNQAIKPSSPLAEAAYEALCLYRNSQGACYSNSPADFTASVGATGDPFFFASFNQSVSCCKSFILMISPGVPLTDGNAPDAQSPFGNLLSTGTSNVGLTTTQLDDVAFYGQTHDVRDQTSGAGVLSGTQKVTFYAVNAMGGTAGSGNLSSAAKFGGFEDRNNNGVVDETGQTCTFPVGSNLSPTPLVATPGTSSAEWDLDKDCTPDTFFDASDGGDLENQINRAIADILKKAASGTSVSVLATSSTGEGALFQAYFFPSQFEGLNEVKWFGFTQGLFVDTFGNLREDYSGPGCTGPPDGKLVLEHDCIVKTRFDTLTNEVKVDRFKDTNGDGIADSTTPFETVGLKDIHPIWEAGARLAYLDPQPSCTTALAGVSCRRILTWADTNNDKAVGATEVIELTAANKATLCPYLAAGLVLNCNSAVAADQTAALTQASNIIRFHRGEDGVTAIGGLRDRTITVRNPDDPTAFTTKAWKLGDVVFSTPTVVTSPRERYDVIYGDATYSTFFAQYKNRRQVAYVGANDGMLHAFNAGFFTAGDDSSTTTVVEHGIFSKTPPATITTTRATPKLGAELWAFVPQELLPHLKWYTQTDYTHVSYVDMKPKVTEVRIFCGDTTAGPNGSPSTCIDGQPGSGVHPGGWGTILIGGMRYGGSCGNCTSTNGGPAMTVTADFNGDGNTTSAGDTRLFYAAYFALDITDPEQDPKLLWVFTDSSLGLAASFPAVLRELSTSVSAKTDKDATWFAVFGSGPTGYIGNSTQKAKFFVVNLMTGPTYSAGAYSGPTFSTNDANSFMGDVITLDSNLDFRVEAIYAGNVITSTTTPPSFKGKMYRLTTGSSTDTTTWGIACSGTCETTRKPSALISSFAYTTTQATTCATVSPCSVGPVTAAPNVTSDDTGNIWILFGTGRFFSTADKTNTDIQHFFGVKDSFLTGGSPAQTTERNNLFNSSNVIVCTSCAGSANVSTNGGTTAADFTTSFDTGSSSLMAQVLNVDGWFTTFSNPPNPLTPGERNLSLSTLIGGTLFFTTFTPTSDICQASGTGQLYAVFYQTGGPYKESAIGTTSVGGSTLASKSISLGQGLPSQMAVQLGAAGSGTSGSTSSSGCSGRITGFIQASTGVLGQVCGKSAFQAWSRMLSWRDL